MLNSAISPAQAAAELLRRRRARESLLAFSQSISIPGAPMPNDLDEWLFKPIESVIAPHHVLTMEAIERCVRADMGRLMVFEPPGSAKSTYASVVGTTWAMGAFPGLRVLMTGYAGKPIIRHSKRARQIARSLEYGSIWPDGSLSPESPAPLSALLVSDNKASDEWELCNGSGLFAAGILGGITSSRADLIVIDDPVAGRLEANSPTIRNGIRAAYDDDVLTRLKPNASIVLIQTRWHDQDLAGSILPEDWNGASGMIDCRDGMTWEVLCIPAKAERADDPLGREIGEYLWPEWFPRKHWVQFEINPRTWAALFQQRPRPDEGNQFEASWFEWYDEEEVPDNLRIYGASDYAVTKRSIETDPDYTEHGVIGLDQEGRIFIRDWWFGQQPSDVTVTAELALGKRWKPITWYGEAGVIEKAISPLRKRLAREGNVHVFHEFLPSVIDKVSRVAAFRARAHAGMVYLPRGKPWASRLLDQLVAFRGLPGDEDDGVDVCGLFGRALDDMQNASKPSVNKQQDVKPFTRAWLEQSDRRRAQEADEARKYYR